MCIKLEGDKMQGIPAAMYMSKFLCISVSLRFYLRPGTRAGENQHF